MVIFWSFKQENRSKKPGIIEATMAKAKNNGGVQNRALYSRVSFLQQAATFLSTSSTRQQPPPDSKPAATTTSTTESTADDCPHLQGMARRLVTHLRSVSLKSRIRLAPAVKQTICKFCDSVLSEGQSCTSTVENRSRGGKKPWADVLVRKCHTCGRERRYPISAPRPKRKTQREGGDEVAKEGSSTHQLSKQTRKTERKQHG